MSAPAGNATAAARRMDDPAAGPRIKVCGATQAAEVVALGGLAVDFVGLWYGVPGGPADLQLGEWKALVDTASTADLTPVLVTFAKDVDLLRDALAGTPAAWVQLHGYQTPGVVRALKGAVDGVRVIKVLHVRGRECVEEPLIASYEKAGVDVFLLDAVAEDGRVGSTGQTLDVGYAASLVERVSRPFLLAGGISSVNRDRHAALVSHPRFLGIDVDTNARGADGRIAAGSVSAIARAWRADP